MQVTSSLSSRCRRRRPSETETECVRRVSQAVSICTSEREKDGKMEARKNWSIRKGGQFSLVLLRGMHAEWASGVAVRVFVTRHSEGEKRWGAQRGRQAKQRSSEQVDSRRDLRNTAPLFYTFFSFFKLSVLASSGLNERHSKTKCTAHTQT